MSAPPVGDLAAPAAEARADFLLVSGDFVRTGGMDMGNYYLAEFLARQGNRVHIVSHRTDPALLAFPNVTWKRASRPRSSTLLGEPLLRWLGHRAARRWRGRWVNTVVNGGNCALPDVNWVHYVHAASQTVSGGGLLRQAKTRLAHRLFLRQERKAVCRARIIIANSKRTKEDLLAHYPLDPATIFPVYYGINPAEFHPAGAEERERLRATLDLPRDACLLAFVGALGDRRKGFDTLFEAWKAAGPEMGSRAVLVVIGTGAELPRWQRLAAEQTPAGSVRFLGFRRDVPAILRACDGFVAPTRYEAFGLAVQEALCCGLPTLVSASAGVAERYPESIGRLLLGDPESVPELVAALREIVGRNDFWKAAVQPVAAALRERTWEIMAREICQLIENS